jgi:hypothetical protein
MKCVFLSTRVQNITILWTCNKFFECASRRNEGSLSLRLARYHSVHYFISSSRVYKQKHQNVQN